MLTELESCILGVIWRGGPMSAYGVRAHFAGSNTVTWSSSTGTVYPAIKRLRQSGYLKAGAPSGPRKSETLTLTPKGREALDQWLTQLRPDLASSTADPIRTRVHFLAALGRAERRRVLADYEAATAAAIASLEAKLDDGAGDRVAQSERLGTLGALAELRARLEWLRSLAPELDRLSPD